ncbi:MAG: tRNA-specific 2-thiouridylase [Parcubacteria group bacterium Athens0714_25]|nr:MAG: tRNA-specific 2-thiouridylase [Parcubacteria group bacterium Athens0714_25]
MNKNKSIGKNKTAKDKKKKRVVLALSSGVDSSVSAALLKKQGYDVVGVFMHFWKDPEENELVENKCCSLEAFEDARKVAQILDIPLYTVNAAKEFKKEVVDYFLDEIKAGRTPNPCVACNPRIKFKFLFQKMLEMDADFVATGHYARIKRELPITKSKISSYHLFQAEDKGKDQTYFLYNLTQKQLAKIIFPVGEYQKPEIRKLAKKFGLPVFDKDDSQGICFTQEKYPTNFIKRNTPMKKGEIVNTDGKVVGEHEGLSIYTIGQRKGINIGGTGPYYVVEKDLKKNILIVTNKEDDPKLFKKEMQVRDINWIGGSEPKFPLKVNVKIRYRNPLVDAIIRKATAKSYEVEFVEVQKAVTPGQSAVFYADDGEVLGGGIIKIIK